MDGEQVKLSVRHAAFQVKLPIRHAAFGPEVRRVIEGIDGPVTIKQGLVAPAHQVYKVHAQPTKTYSATGVDYGEIFRPFR
jgi:hypothetical protein